MHFGHFLSDPVRMPLVRPVGNQPTEQVIRTKEKDSDVNPAVHLLKDGWLDAYDKPVGW